jgi:hypothetical protein
MVELQFPNTLYIAHLLHTSLRSSPQSIAITQMSVAFTMKFYMSRWSSFVDDILTDRAETQAALFFERARKKSKSFLAWVGQTKRSIELQTKSDLLVSIVKERMCRKALVHWDNKTISRHNAKINFKVLKKRSENVSAVGTIVCCLCVNYNTKITIV